MVIGFLGLGEVGSRYSSGMVGDGANVKGYDLKFGLPEFADNEARARDGGVQLVKSAQELVEGSDIILCPTTCAQAVETAQSAAKYLKAGQIYVEFNSAIPSVKAKCQEIVETTGADFIDACTLNSPVLYGHHNRCIISGPRAKEVMGILASYGMDHIAFMGERAGQACAFKCTRSIFMKGIEALFIEFVCAARKNGIMEEVVDSMVVNLSDDLKKQLCLLARSDVVHAKRRAEEIEAIIQMLEDMELDNTMSVATTKKLHWAHNLGLKEKFNNTVPESMEETVDAFIQAQS